MRNPDRMAARPVLLLASVSCGGELGRGPDEQFMTISDSVTDDGTAGGDDAAGTGEGGDETGASIPTAVEDHCLFDPVGLLYGYRYQCEGSVAVDIAVAHAFDGGMPDTDSFVLGFGPGAEGDSYDEPLVMACCPWYAEHEPHCGQPHERACWIDLVEQGCQSLVGKIEDFAWERFPGVLDAAKRGAVLKVAEYVRDHQAGCIAAFREGTAIASTPESCDEKGNGPDFGEMLEAGVWSFDPPGAVQLVELSVQAATFQDLSPLDDDGRSPEICWSADENDGSLFLEVDPPEKALVMHLASGSASIAGPSADGYGELASASTLAILGGNAPSLENLALHSAGGAEVVAYGMTVPVDAFHLRLWDHAPAVAEGSTLVIAPGTARFIASATALGESRFRIVTNATPIVVTHDAKGWRTSSFAIEQTIDGEAWSVVIAPARWHDDG